jgi:predicted transcriptional regulator
MAKKRRHGERGSSIITEIDLVLLKELYRTNKEYSVLELKEKLNLANLSTRRHLNWLVQIGLVSRTKIPKTNRAVLKITKEGEEVLILLERILKSKKK